MTSQAPRRLVDEAAVLDGAHPHGYLLVNAGTAPAQDTRGWRTEPDLLPGTVLHLHPRTVLSRGRGGRGTVVLLGHPVDVAAGIIEGDRIAGRLAGTWDLGGQDALVREAASLGGRWTLLAAPRADAAPVAELLVVPDTHATQPVFSAVAGGRFALASTPALVARTLELAVDEPALTLLEELRRRRGGAVTYLPGRRTAYLGLEPLVPNCLVRVRLRPDGPPTVRQERFWPWRQREETTDVRAVYRAFRERLAAHTQLLAGLGRPALSLTAGWDSRVTAAVAQDALRAGDGFAFTYVNPRDARGGRAAMADVTGASAVSAQLAIPHRVLRWRQPPPGGTFDVLHRRTYAPLLPSRGAAHAMWADLPRDGSLVQLQSNGGETGTTFIRARTAEPLSPLRLARMMMGASEGLEDLAGQMYDGYQEYAAMTAERLLGYDHHDVFYWEQRMGRWGWQKFTDGDFGHRILLPFNDRVLLETMLSLPYPQREAKVLFQRMLAEEPAARLPARRTTGRAAPETTSATRLGALTRRVGTLLPGAAGRLGHRVGGRLERLDRERVRLTGLDRLTFPRGYAVLPTSAAGSVPTSVPTSRPAARSAARSAARPGWVRTELPGGTMTLEAHPALPHAQVPLEDGGVLVLGEPVDVETGLVGATEVARALAEQLRTHPGTPAAALAAVEQRAATLAGGWLVLLSTPARTVVLPDPLASLGLHLLQDGSGVVSHAGLVPAPTTCLGADHLLAAAGPLGLVPLHPVPLPVLVDLPGAARHAADQGWTRRSRLARHTELLGSRGPVWLGLTGKEASRELLALLAEAQVDVHTVSWWDRLAPDEGADPVFAASALAADAGVPHRVVGLREDVDGSHGDPGRAAREVADAALAQTWPAQDGRDRLPVSDALDQALPEDAVLWLGSQPSPPRALGAPAGPAAVCCSPRLVDLVQGVRPVALPFSDRLLTLLPR